MEKREQRKKMRLEVPERGMRAGPKRLEPQGVRDRRQWLGGAQEGKGSMIGIKS